MADYVVTSVSASDEPGLNPAGGAIVTKLVTFYVGKNGPFFLRYAPADYNAERVLEDMAKQVDILRAIGAT